MIQIKNISLTLLILCIFSATNAQQIDTIKTNKLFKKAILPISLISAGVLINKSTFEKTFQTNIRNKVGNTYDNKIDDFILFAPIVEMYAADLIGVKSKNHWFNQSKYLFISNVISSTLTNRLKVITKKTRPNGDERSFPSGHTTIAFTNAAVLHQEFKESSPILAYSGYAFAMATAGFRVVNNKHWVSDALVGAGIGILVTELVYHFEPLKNFNPFKKNKNISLLPQFSGDSYAVYFSYNF